MLLHHIYPLPHQSNHHVFPPHRLRPFLLQVRAQSWPSVVHRSVRFPYAIFSKVSSITCPWLTLLQKRERTTSKTRQTTTGKEGQRCGLQRRRQRCAESRGAWNKVEIRTFQSWNRWNDLRRLPSIVCLQLSAFKSGSIAMASQSVQHWLR